jgi:hypothetical protein
MMMLPAVANRRNAPSVMPSAPTSRSMSSSQTTESLSVTSLASKLASALFLTWLRLVRMPVFVDRVEGVAEVVG